MKKYISAIMIIATGLCAGCHTAAQRGAPHEDTGMAVVNAAGPRVGTVPRRALPSAIVYKTRTDCSRLVPVALDASGMKLVSFPAPSDITAASRPVSLADGYWLDRRGVGPATVFLSYTYDEYAALQRVPSPQELLGKIAVRHPFSAMYRLPLTASEAYADTAACNKLIRSGFPGCEALISPLIITE